MTTARVTAPRLQLEYSTRADLPAVQEFIDRYWKKDHILARDRELLAWQYRAPRSDPQRHSILLAREGDVITGLLGIIPTDFCDRGQRLAGGWLALWVTVPEKRRERVGLALLQHALSRGLDFVGVLGINADVMPIYRALGFTVRDAVPRWVKIVDSGALRGLVASRAGLYRELLENTPPAGGVMRREKRVDVVAWSPELAPLWDDAWQRRFAPALCGTWRDSAYLRWRYLEHPRFEYRVLLARDTGSGAVLGLAVFRTEPVRGRSEHVVRLVEMLGDDSAYPELLAAVASGAQAAGAAFIDFYCTSAAAAGALQDAGYFRDDLRPAPLPSLFQPLDFSRTHLNAAWWTRDPAAASQLASSLYCTRSDGDQDRPN